MTTIAYRDGVMAADSRTTVHTEAGGSRLSRCEKLYRKNVVMNGSPGPTIIGTAGESAPGLIFVDWWGTGNDDLVQRLIDGDADITVLILTEDGLFEADKYCRPEKILDEFWAVGSGAKAALAAMHMGATAEQAVEIACRIDPYSAPPVTSMRLKDG